METGLARFPRVIESDFANPPWWIMLALGTMSWINVGSGRLMRSKLSRWMLTLLWGLWPGLEACEAAPTNGREAPEEEPRESAGVVLLEADIPATGTLEIERPRFAPDEYGERREHLVRRTIENWGVKDAAVLRAMQRVPRHQFMPTLARGRAYDDSPVPIGRGKTSPRKPR